MKPYKPVLTVLGILWILSLCAANSHSETATFMSADIPKVIYDNTTVTSTINVSGLPPYMTNVTVTLNELLHTADGELKLFITSPVGTRIELFARQGGTGDNFIQTILDDDGPAKISSGTPPFTGSFRPVGVLAEFDSETPNGTWILEITDTATDNTGVINNWSLTISAGKPLGEWFIKKISNSSTENGFLKIHGSYVTWEGRDAGDWEIYLHNLNTAVTTKVTSNNAYDRYPHLWGSNVVWEGDDGSDTAPKSLCTMRPPVPPHVLPKIVLTMLRRRYTVLQLYGMLMMVLMLKSSTTM
jgi:beta propeller repeat protein